MRVDWRKRSRLRGQQKEQPEQKQIIQRPVRMVEMQDPVSRDTFLQVLSYSSTATYLLVSAEILTPSGRKTFSQILPTDATREKKSAYIPLTDGELLTVNIAISPFGPAVSVPSPGICFVRAGLIRGNLNNQPYKTVIAQYVHDNMQAAYPGNQLKDPLEGPGNIRLITGTNPAAGAEISESVPDAARWNLLAINFQIVTDATVINRQPSLFVTSGATNVWWAMYTMTVIPASSTFNINYAQNNQGQIAYGGQTYISHQMAMLGNRLLLYQGMNIITRTTGLQAGDNLSAPVLYLEEWIIPV